MDNRQNPPNEPRKGLLSGRYTDSDAPQRDQERSTPPSGGLLSRFGSSQEPPQPPADAPPEPRDGAGWRGGLAGGARKLGQNLRRMTESAAQRAPRHRDWRATDFAPQEIEEWDQRGAVPFELPPDPDAPGWDESRVDAARGERGSRRDAPRGGGRDSRRKEREKWESWEESEWDAAGAGDWNKDWENGAEVDWANASWDDERNARGRGRADMRGRRDYDDGYDDGYGDEEARGGRGSRRGDRWDADDEWDREDGRSGAGAADGGWDVVDGLRGSLDTNALSESLGTLAQLGAVSRPISRVARIQLLLRRRPAAAAMLSFFLLGFMLTCCAPLVPLLRLGYDITDLARRAEDLRALSAGGATSLINASNITRAQKDVAAIEADLYEINGAVAVAGAPAAAISHAARNYQLLVRIGYDLTGAASESLQIAQSLVTPLEGGALSTSTTTPGIQPSDIQQARVLLSDVYVRALDAIAAYQQIDPQALPAQLKPGTKYGSYLAQLPLVVKVIGQMKGLIDAAPALLGVGQPAYYLALALDDSELRPGGGFMGNYGILELDGGKQSKANPFALQNTYTLDQVYAKKLAPNPEPYTCPFPVALPTNEYWWWPYRCIREYGWGLRDSNLSPDFPTNARLAMQVVEASGMLPKDAPIQGVVAFTPGLIQKILEATGDLELPAYHVKVTPQNLVQEIHHFQLDNVAAAGTDRKAFTHDLSKALLDRIKAMHGSGLKVIFKIATDSIQSKDLQVYIADPRAELLLQQLGLASSVATGAGDGFMVVDANDGGNKANLYVSETQTDLVTLLPNGGAFHRLMISVTYNKTGSIYNPVSPGETKFDDYSDVQRTYLPGDATIAGWSGFNPSFYFSPGGCNGDKYSTFITDCSPDHGLFTTTTNSDVPGRAMVMGALLVMCGSYSQGDFSSYDYMAESATCEKAPVSHTQTIFISWYTPHAYTVGADGHGTYTEFVQKQAGDYPHLTVYVTRGSLPETQVVKSVSYFNGQTAHAQKAFDGPLTQDQVVSFSF